MKIIFDNWKQENVFFEALADSSHCPSELGGDEAKGCAIDCEDCWRNCGIEVEVKGE